MYVSRKQTAHTKGGCSGRSVSHRPARGADRKQLSCRSHVIEPLLSLLQSPESTDYQLNSLFTKEKKSFWAALKQNFCPELC